jgi:hypothetical protein
MEWGLLKKELWGLELECEFHMDNLLGSLVLAWWDLASAIGFFSFGMMVLQLESPILVWWEREWEQEEVVEMENEFYRDLASAIGSFGKMALQLESPILVWWEREWEQEEVAVMERERDQEYNCNIDSREPFQREM